MILPEISKITNISLTFLVRFGLLLVIGAVLEFFSRKEVVGVGRQLNFKTVTFLFCSICTLFYGDTDRGANK